MRQEHDLASDLVLGALAGAAATWVMGKVTTALYEQEGTRVREEENRARGNETAYARAAGKAAGLVGKQLTMSQRQEVGTAVHWALGAGAGAAYGVLKDRVPGADWGNGAAFGTAFFLAMDEGANWALGLTPGPLQFPWQAHARGLVGHLVYGMVADSVLEIGRKVVRA